MKQVFFILFSILFLNEVDAQYATKSQYPLSKKSYSYDRKGFLFFHHYKSTISSRDKCYGQWEIMKDRIVIIDRRKRQDFIIKDSSITNPGIDFTGKGFNFVIQRYWVVSNNKDYEIDINDEVLSLTTWCTFKNKKRPKSWVVTVYQF